MVEIENMGRSYRVKINFLIKAIILLLVISLCPQVSLMKHINKTENNNLNKTLDLHAMAEKYEELIQKDLYTPLDTFNGDLTGYAADCPLCGGKLGCNGLDVLTNRTTNFYDSTYGTVRIVASSGSLPCGSIVQFDLPGLFNEKVTAIVLDRGVGGTNLDLLVESEEYAYNNIGRQYITYDVLRFGYKR